MGNVGRSALASSKPNAEPDQDMTSARRHRARRFTRGLLPPLPELSKTRQRMTRLTRSVRLTKAQAEWHPVQAAPESQPTEQRWTREPSSALNLYLREVGQVNLLTPREEVALAQRVQAGDEAAREHMIRANLRLVVKIAREYDNLGLPLLDLLNEGNIGLMKAVEKFDPAKGSKLSSYSSWWIKQSIRRALANQSKTIRLPVNAVEEIGVKFHLTRERIRQLQNLALKKLRRMLEEPEAIEVAA